MKYKALVDVYKKLELTTKRLEKTKIISDLLSQNEDISLIVLLLQGRIFPRNDETKLGVASKLVAKAIGKATGLSNTAIENEWKKTGDLGITAQNMVGKKTQATLYSEELSVGKVFSNMKKLANLEGMGSVDQKIQLLSELLTSAQPEEARYIVRTVLEDLRVGVGEGSLRDAITWSVFSNDLDIDYETFEINDRENYNKYINAVQEAYDITNDFGTVADIARTKGLSGLLNQDLSVGRPVKVMLALKANDATEALERVGTPAEVEFKLDGFRMQIHKNKEEITLFTRRLENVTHQFPDVVEAVKEYVSATVCILDAEVVGFSPTTKKYLPFQSISQRIRRKYNISDMVEKFPVEVNVFDILLHDKKNLVKEPFSKRRGILEKIVSGKERSLVLVKKIITEKVEDIQDFFEQSKKAGNEGLMIKNLESPYKPGARVGYMVKLKDTMENLDLVIIGAEWGEGKRSSWLSSYTLACIDADGNFLTVGKVATGLKEKKEEGLSFEEMTTLLQPLIISEKGKDVKVKPEIIIEVAYEEIQKSPTYESGFALRFPRVVRLRSDERGEDDVITLDYLEELYYGQGK